MSLVVAHPPPKPLLIFDGDCHFCRRWIARWQEMTGERVSYVSSQIEAGKYPEIPSEDFRNEVILIEPDGTVTGGAEAVFRTLAHSPRRIDATPFWAFQNVPGVRPITVAAYAFVARHREQASALTRLLWGDDVTRPTYFTARRWFLRALGLIYLIAFASLWRQIEGLVGHDGILPVGDFIVAAHKRFGPTGVLSFPTLCWWNASDGFLHFLCAGGAALSLLLIADLAPALCLALLWVFYLSLSVAGQVFLSFQWDALLLETGFLSIFLAAPQWRTGRAPISGGTVFLLQWLLFGLMLMSGIVKLTSGDSCWIDQTALHYHYETQPLPTLLGWWMHQAPAWFQKASSAFLFDAELIAPFFIFGPRSVRTAGATLLVLLQLLIAATGNYGFFNLLTLALCLLLIDDAQWPRRLVVQSAPGRRWPRWIMAPLVAIFVFFNLILLWSCCRPKTRWPAPIAAIYGPVEPLRTINSYGLFRVMTRTRPEIILEASDDAVNWRPLAFRWKPGALDRAPAFVAPYMPRLDWQMWFAALGGSPRENEWFIPMAEKILRGSPSVLNLLAGSPKAPKYLRAQLYEYHFTSPAERRASGNWWRRELLGPYCPAISLEDFQD